MFQPEPTPYASFYGVGSGAPGYAYSHQPALTPINPYLGGEAGQGDRESQQPGGGADSASGLPGVEIAAGPGFGGVAGGIGASRAGATAGLSATASGPARAISLLFTSAVFPVDNSHNVRNAHNGAAGPGACIPVTNNYPLHPSHQHPPAARFRRYSLHQTQSDIEMASDLGADLAAQEAAAREYQPHLEVWRFVPWPLVRRRAAWNDLDDDGSGATTRCF